MKDINLLPALNRKSDVLLGAVGMENINPEYGAVGAVFHATQLRVFVFYWLKSSGDTHDDFYAW